MKKLVKLLKFNGVFILAVYLKDKNYKELLELFAWLMLGIFIILILIGFVLSYLDPTYQFFTPFTSVIDTVFTILSVLNPITHYIGFEFKPIFQGVPNSLTNKNPIIMDTLSEASLVTLQISVVSMIVGFIIANVVAIILISPGPVFGLKYISQIYVDFLRSTPLVLQMLVMYLSVPQFLQTIGWTTFRIDGLTSATVALALNTGAYQSEIIRAGILSIPAGQTEASRGLGFTQFQTFRYVIIPQALRLIIPPLTNEGINVILNSSLAYVLAVPELTRKARDLSVKWFLAMQILAVAALFYFVMAYSLAKVTKKMEKRLRIPGLGVQNG